MTSLRLLLLHLQYHLRLFFLLLPFNQFDENAAAQIPQRGSKLHKSSILFTLTNRHNFSSYFLLNKVVAGVIVVEATVTVQET